MLSVIPSISSTMSMLRSSSRRRTQRQRFDPSSIGGGGGDDLRSPAAGAYSTPARSSTTDSASRSNVSAGFDAADGVGPPSTNGPPSSLRSASRSVRNQLGGGVNASLPGKLSGRGKSVFMKAGEFRGVCRGEERESEPLPDSHSTNQACDILVTIPT